MSAARRGTVSCERCQSATHAWWRWVTVGSSAPTAFSRSSPCLLRSAARAGAPTFTLTASPSRWSPRAPSGRSWPTSRRRSRKPPGSRGGGRKPEGRLPLTANDLEIVRGLYEAFRRRDNESPFEVFDEEIIWDASTVHFDDWEATGLLDEFRGHDGVRRYWRQWLDAWSEIEFEYELTELEDGRIAGVVDQRNRARHSGIWMDQPRYAQIWTLRGGMVVRMEFADPASLD